MLFKGKRILGLISCVLMIAVLLACGDSGGGGSDKSDPLAEPPDAGNYNFVQSDGRTGTLTIDGDGNVTSMVYDGGSGDGEITETKSYGPNQAEWVMEYRICWGDSCYSYQITVFNQPDDSWKGQVVIEGQVQDITLTKA